MAYSPGPMCPPASGYMAVHVNINIAGRISGSNNSGYRESCLLGYNAVYTIHSQPPFHRKIKPPSSGLKPSKKPVQCRQRAEPEDGGDIYSECRLTFNELRASISQRTELFTKVACHHLWISCQMVNGMENLSGDLGWI
jgi:hypothetical protein